jgi:hypothetical protein
MRKASKYRPPLEDVDLSGKVKLETLEEVLLEQKMNGWCTAKDLYQHSTLGAYLYQSEWRCISIRLLRYWRAGLLIRRRKGRRFKYRLSEKGENRLIYLWEKFGCLEVSKTWEMERLGKTQKELTEIRQEFAILILNRQNKRDKRKLKELLSN